jgi:hypothetical protein
LLAPLRRKEIPTGITLQEQSGRGIPNKEERSTEENPFFFNCFSIKLAGSITLIIPANRNPKTNQRAPDKTSSHVAKPHSLKYSKTYFLFALKNSYRENY